MRWRHVGHSLKPFWANSGNVDFRIYQSRGTAGQRSSAQATRSVVKLMGADCQGGGLDGKGDSRVPTVVDGHAQAADGK